MSQRFSVSDAILLGVGAGEGAAWMVGAAWVGTGAAMAFTSAAPVLLSLSLAIFFLTRNSLNSLI